MPHFFYAWTLANTFFDIGPQKRSRVTKFGAQTQHRVIHRFLPPSTSKQSKSEIEITCARDKGVVFSSIGQAISGSTVLKVYVELRCTAIEKWRRRDSTGQAHGKRPSSKKKLVISTASLSSFKV